MSLLHDFIAERIRVRAEQLRALRVLLADDAAVWQRAIESITPNTDDIVTPAGVKPLSGADVRAVMACGVQVLTSLNGARALDAVTAACVRPVDVELRR